MQNLFGCVNVSFIEMFVTEATLLKFQYMFMLIMLSTDCSLLGPSATQVSRLGDKFILIEQFTDNHKNVSH